MDECGVLVLMIPFLTSGTSEIGVAQQLLSLQGGREDKACFAYAPSQPQMSMWG